MGNFRIPTPIAVVMWVSSGLAVLSYTYLAFKETSGEDHPINPLSSRSETKLEKELVSKLPELKPLPNETPVKPLLGRRFGEK